MINRDMYSRIDVKAAEMTQAEVVSAIRRHVKRMRTTGASALPSSVLERAADLLECPRLMPLSAQDLADDTVL